MKDIRNLLTFFQEINERLVVIWMLLMQRALQRKSLCVLFLPPKYLFTHESRLKLILINLKGSLDGET